MPFPFVAAAAAIGAASGAAGIGTGISDMSPTHRQCTVHIKNNCSQHTLCNPRVHITSGSSTIPLSPTVECGTTETGIFIKTPHTARGSVGVFTYDLQNNSTRQCSQKMAVMFSVPYDFNLYSNWYALGTFGMGTRCDYDLYYNMYNNGESGFVRGKASDPGLVYRSSGFTVKAMMSDTYQPVIKVEVSDR